jgi:arylsulfatase A-like enzyme
MNLFKTLRNDPFSASRKHYEMTPFLPPAGKGDGTFDLTPAPQLPKNAPMFALLTTPKPPLALKARKAISYPFSRAKLVALIMCLLAPGAVIGADRPNIVWIVVDDMSSHFAYQGEKLVDTPHVDRLAKEGVIFSHAYATAPVCSTFRTAMITGCYQTTIGGHHHRSSRGTVKIHLPDGVRTVPEIFREAGYYTSNGDASGSRWGKEDYNFDYSRADLYDGTNWSKRQKDQPFFAQFQLRGGKLRNVPKWYDEEVKPAVAKLVTSEHVTLPPCYPDHPAIREDWAQYLNSVQYTDMEVGRIMDRLKADGLLDNTIVFFFTDHGISHARGKQFLYEEGVEIPFVVWAPKRLKSAVRDELISHIDLAAGALQLAGIPIPKWMQGRPLFGPEARPRDFVAFARDRCDETVDRIRGIRLGNFKYIRNYHPQRPYLQPCAYKDKKPFMPPLRELFAAGKLNKAQSLHMAATRSAEELYDLDKDPWEIHNLANDPAHQERLRHLRGVLANWEIETNDLGRVPESQEAYDSEMEVYVQQTGKRHPEYAAQVKKNVALMNKWRAEGK